MYTAQEEAFIKYWSEYRLKKKKVFRQMLVGAPIGIVFVIAILVNFFSGWHKRATMVANADSSLFFILIIAGLLIVAFAGLFASYHKWDVNETRYQELIKRRTEV